ADGRVFGLWTTSTRPQGLVALVLRGKQVEVFEKHASVGHVLPGPSGSVLYTAAGLFTTELRELSEGKGRRGCALPAARGDFYLVVRAIDPFDRNSSEPVPGTVTVYLTGEARPLLTLSHIPVPAALEPWAMTTYLADKRVRFIPAAKLMVTIP